ncbi:hypothetical protein LCGC14_2165810 [marine sediment metagenome]|uniref:Uncharacterized protein n=1 Tax=marine sediment metagenome TaxID=412755 RepID=A0A0F9EDR8_9ZZZZ
MLKISTNVPCTIKPNCCGCLHGYFNGCPAKSDILWIFICNECGAESGRGLESYVKTIPAKDNARPELIPFLDVVFDGPPGHESGRFVEVEDPSGKSVCAGEWIDRGDGMWALRIGISLKTAPESCDCEGIILKAGGHRVDCPLNEAAQEEG